MLIVLIMLITVMMSNKAHTIMQLKDKLKIKLKRKTNTKINTKTKTKTEL
jgi:hypothetical protein